MKNFLRTMLCLSLVPVAAAQHSVPRATEGTAERYDSTAAAAAAVVFDHARFTVLTPQLIRLEWSADGTFEDRASFTFLNRHLAVPKFSQQLTGSGDTRTLTIDTGALKLTYQPAKGDEGFTSANLSIALDVNGKSVSWKPGMAPSGNLLGTARTLDGVKGDDVKLEQGLLSRDGWTLVDDSSRLLFDSADFSMSKGLASNWPWFAQRKPGKRVDWYFFGYGHEYAREMGDYVRVAGRIPLPPRYAFGMWWSRYWAYSDQELNELVSGFRSRNLPLDVLVIDMDWHIAVRGNEQDPSGHRKGWTGYTWNKNLFPEPELFLHRLHEEGVHATLNLHPASGVQTFEAPYAEMARAMGQTDGKYVPFQITDRKFAENYFDILHHPLEKQGIDFWWLDWQQEAHTDVAGVDPTFWLNYLHFTDQEREGKRPMLFHRWGGLGNHRYQIGFSGDTISKWESLAFQPNFTATAANVGYAYWSHDIGGHMPGAIEPELYLRWLQFGAFSPILRTHTTKNPEAERRVWAYPEPYSDIMEATLRQRAAWIPYIYTEARRTYDTGVAFLRPLYYSWPEQNEAYDAKNEFLFGDNVIVAPVTSPVDSVSGLAQESLWLPQGEWIEQSSGRHLQGGARMTREYSLEQTPVFMRPGTIVPMQPPMLHVGEKAVDPLIVRVAALDDKQQSSYSLYEDSSEGRGYEDAAYTRTELSASREGAVTTLVVHAAKGSYVGMVRSRAIQLELPGDWPPTAVSVNGKRQELVRDPKASGWRFEGNTLTTIVLTDSFSTAHDVTIRVERDPKLVAQSSLLDGFAGKMVDLRRAYAQMNDIWPVNDLVAASQTGDRIGYRPEQALQEVKALPGLITSAQRGVEEFAVREDKDWKVAPKPKDDEDAAAQHRKQAANQVRLKRARAALVAAAKN
ncbi:glycoside hydrolase family 31 protein [Granulicella cerasi]|uniref:glycoside hydrolase family 31 protein n=1 Tax=Granulicella cerasi TaxID=741063 RepID=UPI0021E0985E|nr:TIM-barrel domain-containing protein [Granulicella cerasi]